MAAYLLFLCNYVNETNWPRFGLDILLDEKKRDHYDVIIMVFMARFLFNHGYACSGGRHVVACVFFQLEPRTPSVIHI